MPSRPNARTVKQLFAVSGNHCAFPECARALVIDKTVVGEICHIRAQSAGGPRYDPAQSDAERRGFDNLVLMCPAHHKVIDDHPGDWPVERLVEIKTAHEAGQRGGGELSDAEAQALLDKLADILQAHRLPVPLQRPPRAAHFTGRRDELERLIASLQPGQVVTLCGPGGIGKSALAAEAVWALPPGRFPDGIITHSFYNQPQADVALEHVARSLGQEPRPSPHEAALRALAGRCVLLYLDGTEDADDLPAVLAVRGGCGVLVTSRSRGDAVSGREDLGPLPPPQAVALLRAWGGAYASDRAAAERVCQLVGGLPLAVRLAGRFLDEQQEHVETYLRWLQETPLSALDHGEHRQESVGVLLARSIAQVGEAARAALGIAGALALVSFDLAAVVAALDLPEREARNALGELLGYGLLLRARDSRYEASHALIHTYARRRCAAPGEAVARLAAHYAALAEEQSALGAVGYRRLDAERMHLVQVVRACAARQEWAAGLALVQAIKSYCRYQGHWIDLGDALRHAQSAAHALGDQGGEANCIQALGDVHRMLAEYDAARARYEEARPVYAAIGDRLGEANCIKALGDVHIRLAEYDAARARYEEAQSVYRQIGDRYNYAGTSFYLGLTCAGLDEMEAARQYVQEALHIFGEILPPGHATIEMIQGILADLSEE
jgi:tetratricopeptide (TPR) repeat protein